MSDYGTMQGRIANEINRGDLTSEIQNSILSSLDHYKFTRLRWNTARTETTTTANIEYYGLPDDFLEQDSMVLIDGNDLDWLDQRSHFWIDREKRTDNYYSRPNVFSVQGDELRLYPTPDKAYTLRMTYVYELDKPTVSGSTSDWFTKGEELIRLHAKVDLLENVIRGPESFQEAQILRNREGAILKQLRKEYKRSQSAGQITPRG